MYERPSVTDSLSQGDILDECPLLLWEMTPSLTGSEPVAASIRVRVVVLTQACDLALEKATRVLVAVVASARHLVERGVVTAKSVREQIRTHRVYGLVLLAERTNAGGVDRRPSQPAHHSMNHAGAIGSRRESHLPDLHSVP